MRKHDFIIIILIFIVFLISTFFVPEAEKGSVVKVHVDSELVFEHLLSEDIIKVINGVDNININLVVNGGFAYVKNSDCADGLCIKQGLISKTNESIICLPGKIVISIDSQNKSEYDSISR